MELNNKQSIIDQLKQEIVSLKDNKRVSTLPSQHSSIKKATHVPPGK